MKKIIYFFLNILIIGCNQSQDKNTYHLEYVHQTNEPIYIFKIDNNNPVKIDSSVSKSGKHEFDINLKELVFSSRKSTSEKHFIYWRS